MTLAVKFATCSEVSVTLLKSQAFAGNNIAFESFKILNNLSPVYLNDLLTFKTITLLGTRRRL